ncbi:MAG: polysaccharide deacetylase family protein [Gemmatimonadaceae bacterium]|nr:polysaccharide deacetylase family protein [Gemmatimonadaceae bacterium]
MRNDHWVALCYHDVRAATNASGGGPERFAVPVAAFERMLDTIQSLGFRGCSLAEARTVVDARRVAITFDDATQSQFERAMPALRERGMTASVYVVTDWVGRPGYMDWDQLRQIKDWGMSVQSHSKSHPFLSELGRERLQDELALSRERLDRELRQETAEIAFPGGDAPRRSLRAMIRACGYCVAVGSRWGVNIDGRESVGFLRRCTVRGDLDPDTARQYVLADPRLAWKQHPREFVLRSLRSTLGPSRYARWRRRLLDAVTAPVAAGG